jgi:restriction system protein
MTIPTYQDCMLPYLRALADGETHHVKRLIASLEESFSLTEEERSQLLPSGQTRTIVNRVGWAKTYLKKAGLIKSSERGYFKISETGKSVLAEAIDRIDYKYLMRFESFREFRQTKKKPQENHADVEDLETSRTPVEAIEVAHEQLNAELAADLLDKLKDCSPYFFEKVVLRLLRAMGYGGTTGRGVVTPASSDGGIDGIIYEDKLGLDSVCIQAKRWEGTVGRPTVQEFVGSMDLHRSRKGVVLTTSRFSRDAIEYVERIEGKKVVLIDGDELCRLMIEHRVGVATRQTYELFDVSEDFFDEDN